jgi:hypothetical protein
MSSSRFFLALAAASLLLLARPLFAAEDWQPITPQDLKMTADPAHPEDAIILYHEEVSDDNRNHRIVYKRLKIFTKKGRSYANVEITYSGREFHIIDVKARTISPDGTVTPFTGKAYDKTIIKGHGIKYLAKTFTLQNVQPGSIIEWKYTEYWDDHSLYAPHWTLQESLAQKLAKFTFVPYSGSGDVTGEHGLANRVYYASLGLPKDAKINQLPGGRMELEVKDIPAFHDEDLEPPTAVLKMRVDFFYGSDKMGKPAEYWKEQGKYWNKEVEKFIGHSAAVASAAKQAVAGSGTTEQKVRKLYARVQMIKNLSYQESDELDNLRPEDKNALKITAEDILQKNEGKHDQLARLFVAMARSVNIPAWVMRVAPRDETFFQINLPSWRQLTSEVAIVNIDGKEIFLDPGTAFCPFGLLEWMRTGVQGVRQTEKGGTAMAGTPPPGYKQTLTLRVARLTLAQDGSLDGTVKFSWTGQEALSRRIDASSTDQNGRKEQLESELKKILPAGSVAQLLESASWTNPDEPLSATFKVRVPSFASSTSKRLLFASGLFESASKPLFVSAERKYAVHFDYPYRSIDDVQITLPADFEIESLPKTRLLQTDFSYYKSEGSANGTTLSMRRDFAIAGMAFPVKFYGPLRKFFQDVNAGDEEQVVLMAAAK